MTPQDMLAELRADNLHGGVTASRQGRGGQSQGQRNFRPDRHLDRRGGATRLVLVRSPGRPALKLDLMGRETRWPRLLSAPSTLRSTAAVAFDDTGGPGHIVLCIPDGRSMIRISAPRARPKQAEFRVVTMDVRGSGETSARWTDYSARSVGLDAPYRETLGRRPCHHHWQLFRGRVSSIGRRERVRTGSAGRAPRSDSPRPFH